LYQVVPRYREELRRTCASCELTWSVGAPPENVEGLIATTSEPEAEIVMLAADALGAETKVPPKAAPATARLDMTDSSRLRPM
jgi:hypothetical protein